MKKSLLLAVLCAAFASADAMAQAEGHVYVVPVDDDGTAALQADGGYVGQVELTAMPDAPGVSVRRLHIDNGFVFSAVSADGSKHTLYTLRTPPVSFDTRNTLAITDRVSNYIEVPTGTYNITFYRSTGTGTGSSFTITKMATGIDDVEADATAPAEYFDLCGRRAGPTPEPGLYLERRGDKVRKVMLR